MLKHLAIPTLVLCAAASGAFAQESMTAPRNTMPPAVVKDPAATNPNAPVAGKNSFTESQARSRIEKQGYSQVSNLAKDSNSIWHATAVKGGGPVRVSLDYQGNVTEQ